MKKMLVYLSGKRFEVPFISLLFLCEVVLSWIIINKVAYTEIDWEAYNEEVNGYLSGERDYLNIRGGTGEKLSQCTFVLLLLLMFHDANDFIMFNPMTK